MRVKLKENKDWEGNFNGTYCVFLNGREVGNDANNITLDNEWNPRGIKTIYIESPYNYAEYIVGETKTNKRFEISGGRKAGGRHNDWWLDVDGVCVGYDNNAKRLIQLLVCVEWTDEQIELSNRIYKRQVS
tara:strand:+ start:102 stop:494 length:393 start_codon:yes stop_codon:yes gene_type:complete